MTTVANGLALTHDDPARLSLKPPELADAPSERPAPQARHAPFLSRKHILDATLSCLLESGYDGTTIRRIAKRLGCAVGSIYRYFTDKRELLDAVTFHRFEPVAKAIESGASMREGFAQYARTAVEEPELYRLMFWLHSVGRTTETKLPPIIGRIIVGWAKKLGDRRMAERLWSLLHGGIMLGRGADYFETGADLHLPEPAEPPVLEAVITQTEPPVPVAT